MAVHNFNAGPAALPRAVLERAQAELLDYQGRGLSILEMSHRSPEYEAVNRSAEARFKALLGLGDDYRVLFMQGGASAQFAILPMNFLGQGAAADYVVTGVWGEKALEEARRIGLYHRVGPPQDCLLAARAEAERLARGPSFALEVTKKMLYREAAMDLDAALEAEVEIQSICMQDPNFREAYQAFRAKRKPDFR